ncbi:hypothetical protein [Thermotoga sp. KOL6]|uniref:hypothetical protein n=1 Tax=Thermotoga sp. KOL6 TaxID=126741 RepID=UPI000C771C73|nr:hypothetical protein [Thermotoga sp. KOL6]PLV58689.1 hypothetical protein AS005_07325 [Thermotoga sp. KOL6]
MEKLNIYPYKKRKIKVTTFVVLLVVMLLPPISFNIYFRYVKEQMIESLENEYSDILRAYSVDLSIDSFRNLEEVSRIENTLVSQIKELDSKTNSLNAYLGKRKTWEDFSRVLLNIFQEKKRTLSYLSFSKEGAVVEFYEVSKESQTSLFPELPEKAKFELEFEEKLPEGYFLRKYKIEYEVAGK